MRLIISLAKELNMDTVELAIPQADIAEPHIIWLRVGII